MWFHTLPRLEQLTDEQYVRNTVDVLFQHSSLASPETMKRKLSVTTDR